LHKNEDQNALLYASIIQKLQRAFVEVDMFGSVKVKEESKLALIDPFTNEKIQDAKENEDDYAELIWKKIE
jgi:hypothetical protein